VRPKKHESLDQGSKTFHLFRLYTWEWPKQSVDSRERSIQRVKDVRLLKASHSHTRSYMNQWKSWGKSRTLLHLPREAQSKRLSAIQTRCKFQSLSRTLSLSMRWACEERSPGRDQPTRLVLVAVSRECIGTPRCWSSRGRCGQRLNRQTGCESVSLTT
jgi:hypothetical protein